MYSYMFVWFVQSINKLALFFDHKTLESRQVNLYHDLTIVLRTLSREIQNEPQRSCETERVAQFDMI